MKKKTLAVSALLTLIAVFLLSGCAALSVEYGNDTASMERLIAKCENVAAKLDGAVAKVVDDLDKDGCRLAVFVREGREDSSLGLAVFEADEKGNYVLKTAYYRDDATRRILIEFHSFGGMNYDVVVCNRPDLVSCLRTNLATNETITVDMDPGCRIALMDSINAAEVSAYYCFVTEDGSTIE